jgi:hypothetical protein
MPPGVRQRWFAHILQAGVDEKVWGSAHLLTFLTADVLAHHLPPELLTRILVAALTTGSMNGDR